MGDTYEESSFCTTLKFLLLGACGNNDDSVDNVKKSTHKKTTLRFTKIKANQIVQMVKNQR